MSTVDAQLRRELLVFQKEFLQDGQPPRLTGAINLLHQRVGAAARAGLLSPQTVQLGHAIGIRTRDTASVFAKSNQACSQAVDDLRTRLRDIPDESFGSVQRPLGSDSRVEPSSYFSTPPAFHGARQVRDLSAGRDAQSYRDTRPSKQSASLCRDVEDMSECKAWCEKNWRHMYPDAITIRSLALACNAPVARIQTWFSAYRKNSGFNALDAHFQAKGIDLRTADVGHDPCLSRADEAKIACYRGKLSAGGERDFIASTLASVNLSSDEEDSGRSSRSSGSRSYPIRRDAVPLPSRSKPTTDSQGNRILSLAPAPDRASLSFYPPAHLTRTAGDRSSGQPSPTSSTPSPTSSEYGWSGSDSTYSTDATAASMYDERLSQSRRCPSPSFGRSPSSPSFPAGRRSSFSGPAGGLPDQTSRSLYGHPQPPSPQSSRMSSMGSSGPPPSSTRGYGGR